MKRIILLTALAITAITACKKSDSTSTTSTTTAQGITATVNGQAFTTATIQGTPYMYTANGGGGLISIGAFSAVSAPQKRLTLQFFPGEYGKAATYTIVKDFPPAAGKINANYTDENGNYFHGISGTINVTKADTGKSGFTNFTATFNFVTDSASGKNVTVTSGTVNYQSK